MLLFEDDRQQTYDNEIGKVTRAVRKNLTNEHVLLTGYNRARLVRDLCWYCLHCYMRFSQSLIAETWPYDCHAQTTVSRAVAGIEELRSIPDIDKLLIVISRRLPQLTMRSFP